MIDSPASLAGVRILDLSRVLAGPSCTQLLGDLGADVIKVERPGRGDDTRHWGPPFLQDANGPRPESGYYLAANRNKRSIAIDFTQPEGARLITRLAGKCDILVENHRVGSLARYGLDGSTLAKRYPRLIYCSITGFGQTGPHAADAGYDFLAQAMSGIMSITGEIDGSPMKVGVGVADLMCGMYATVAVLAALRFRDASGLGQHIDLSLFDCTVAWLANRASDFLITGDSPKRFGNAHPSIVPYNIYPTQDAWVVIACGNDSQFKNLCAVLGDQPWANDPRFATNPMRLQNRGELESQIAQVTRSRTTTDWIAKLKAHNIPGGPVMTVPEALSHAQTQARSMTSSVTASDGTTVPIVANPIRASHTPPSYRLAPPALGEHTDEILDELLELSVDERARLRASDVVA